MEPAVKSHLPDSPNRGKYLNHAEVNAITQNPEAVTAVESFLVANGVQFKQVDAHSNFIKATATVAKWEEMFNTDVHLVAAESNPSKSFLRAVTDVHLPEDIAQIGVVAWRHAAHAKAFPGLKCHSK